MRMPLIAIAGVIVGIVLVLFVSMNHLAATCPSLTAQHTEPNATQKWTKHPNTQQQRPKQQQRTISNGAASPKQNSTALVNQTSTQATQTSETDNQSKRYWLQNLLCGTKVTDFAVIALACLSLLVAVLQARIAAAQFVLKRAFVFQDAIVPERILDNKGMIREWRFSPVWKNTGETATKHGFHRTYHRRVCSSTSKRIPVQIPLFGWSWK